MGAYSRSDSFLQRESGNFGLVQSSEWVVACRRFQQIGSKLAQLGVGSASRAAVGALCSRLGRDERSTDGGRAL